MYNYQPIKIFVHYVSSDEYEKIKEGIKKFVKYNDNIYIDVLDNNDPNILYGYIGVNDAPHTKNGIIYYSYFTDMQNGRSGYFTSDGSTFYEIIDFFFTVDDRVQVRLKKVQKYTKSNETDKTKDIRGKKKRISVPAKTKSLLQKEINSQCPFCESEDVDHFQIHHIDENPNNNDFSNLLMVCPLCHSKITKRDISKDEVEKIKKTLLEKKGIIKKTPPINKIKISGSVSKSIIANNITAQQIVYKGKSKPKTIPHPDSIEADLIMKNYIKHLIDRYQEFIKDDTYKGEKRFAQIWRAIKKEFGTDAYKVPIIKFPNLVLYLHKRILDTRIGRNNNSRGQKLFSSFEEYKEKYTKE